MIEPQVQWVAPQALWEGYAHAAAAQDRARLRRPHILRFATDSFMDEFIGTLANEPERLHQWRVQAETWEGPASNPLPVVPLPPLLKRVHQLRLASAAPLTGTTSQPPVLSGTVGAGDKLKLYQPGHQRFYLISACLVCRLPGLPDRTLDFGAAERVGYVVRRLRPKAGATALPTHFNTDTCDEYAFVNGNRWQRAEYDSLEPGEEVLPMFGVTYLERDGRKRRVLAGTIPVGKRETYVGAAVARILPDPNPPPDVDPRKAVLLRKVTDPWRSLIEQYDKAQAQIASATGDDIPKVTRLRIESGDSANLLSWLVLLDLGEFLHKYLPKVWDVITGTATEVSLGTGTPAHTLFTAMKNATLSAGGATRSLAQALLDILQFSTALESTTTPYSTVPTILDGHPSPAGIFPNFLFPLTEPQLRTLVVPPPGGTSLDDLTVAALEHAPSPERVPPLPLAAAASTLDRREPVWFTIRCVFERPACVPLTGPLLSEPTESFQMAAFFDPEAPARPIRINLPLDISAAGLRKFDRNTAFMLSDALCGQMKRMGKVTFGDLVLSVLPWPLHKDLSVPDSGPCEESPGVTMGLICSLSIPIITICAFILLIIIVNLLNIIFHWIPFFISCFPLPHFSSKEE